MLMCEKTGVAALSVLREVSGWVWLIESRTHQIGIAVWAFQKRPAVSTLADSNKTCFIPLHSTKIVFTELILKLKHAHSKKYAWG